MSETETKTTETPSETPVEAPSESDTPVEPDTEEEPEEEPEEPEEPGEPHQEPVAAASGPQTEKEIEKALGKLAKHQDTNHNRILAIMGSDAEEMIPCVLCNNPAPGWRFDSIPADPIVQAVRAAIGLADYSDFTKATHTRECDDCRGRGDVLSGSKVPGKEVVKCPKCGGDGFVRIGGVPAPLSSAPTGNGEEVVYADSVEPASETDPWGRRPTDPDFGVMPNLVAQRHAVQGAA